jgi:hypothetical protein
MWKVSKFIDEVGDTPEMEAVLAELNALIAHGNTIVQRIDRLVETFTALKAKHRSTLQ